LTSVWTGCVTEPDLGGIWQADSVADSLGSGDHDRGIVDEEKKLERKLRIGFMLRGEHEEAIEKQQRTAAARGLRTSLEAQNAPITAITVPEVVLSSTPPSASIPLSSNNHIQSGHHSHSHYGHGMGHVGGVGVGVGVSGILNSRERRATPPNGMVMSSYTNIRPRLSVGDRKPHSVTSTESMNALALDAGAVPPLSSLPPLITDDSSNSNHSPPNSGTTNNHSPDAVSLWLRDLNLSGLGLPLMSRDGPDRNTERDLWLLNNGNNAMVGTGGINGRAASLSVGSGMDSLAPIHSLSPSHHSTSSALPLTPSRLSNPSHVYTHFHAISNGHARGSGNGHAGGHSYSSSYGSNPNSNHSNHHHSHSHNRRQRFDYDDDPDIIGLPPRVSPAIQIALAESSLTSSSMSPTSSSLLSEFARFSPEDLERMTKDSPQVAQQLLFELQRLQRSSSTPPPPSSPSSSSPSSFVPHLTLSSVASTMGGGVGASSTPSSQTLAVAVTPPSLSLSSPLPLMSPPSPAYPPSSPSMSLQQSSSSPSMSSLPSSLPSLLPPLHPSPASPPVPLPSTAPTTASSMSVTSSLPSASPEMLALARHISADQARKARVPSISSYFDIDDDTNEAMISNVVYHTNCFVAIGVNRAYASSRFHIAGAVVSTISNRDCIYITVLPSCPLTI
jgi:hypothetical protein